MGKLVQVSISPRELSVLVDQVARTRNRHAKQAPDGILKETKARKGNGPRFRVIRDEIDHALAFAIERDRQNLKTLRMEAIIQSTQ